MIFRPAIFLTLGLLAGLTPFAIDMYLPSIPAIARDLGSSVEIAQLSVPVYLGVFALAQLALGPLSDVIGRRTTMLGGLWLFIAGSLLCMASPTMGWLLAARAVQALGGSAVAVTIPALVRDVFEKDDYARTMSLIMLVMAFAPLVAPLIGGAIITHAEWPWVFFTLSLIAMATTLLFHRLIQETLAPEHRHRFHPRTVAGNYLRLLRHPAGMAYLATAATSFAGMMTFIVGSPYVYIELYGVAERHFGLLFGINVLGAMICGALNARFARRVGAERLLRIGLGVQLFAALLLAALVGSNHPPLPALVAASALYVAMNGFILGNAMAGYMAYFPRLAGTASAFSGTVRFGLGALAGVMVSLFHDGSSRPMVLIMAVSGVVTSLIYWGVCVPAQGRVEGETNAVDR